MCYYGYRFWIPVDYLCANAEDQFVSFSKKI